MINQEPDQSLPKVIRRLISEFSEKFNRRSILHNILKQAPPNNFPPTIETRLPVVTEIAELSDRLDELHQSHKAWENHQTLPDEEKLRSAL